MPPFRKPRTLDNLSFAQFDRALRPRRRRPRLSIVPDGDRYFLTPEELRKLLGYSSYYFYKRALCLPVEHGLPAQVVCGRDGITDIRFRADDTYRLWPHLSPFPPDSSWLDRFKTKNKSDAARYLASKSQKAASEPRDEAIASTDLDHEQWRSSVSAPPWGPSPAKYVNRKEPRKQL